MPLITIPYHLALPCFISLFLILIIWVKQKTLFNRRKWFWISITAFLSTYSFLLISVIYLNNYYYWNLQSFDLDKNGFFSTIERTPEQLKAMTLVASDTARNFAFITGLIYAFIIAIMTYIGGKIFEIFKKRSIREKR